MHVVLPSLVIRFKGNALLCKAEVSMVSKLFFVFVFLKLLLILMAFIN